MSYDALVITAHPDDAETQMGGTLAKLSRAGEKILVVDLTLGEPSDLAPGERARQAAEAARILGVDRITLHHQDRMLVDDAADRLEVAALIREHRPHTVYGIGEACVHPDHVAAASIVRAATFLARLRKWDQVPGGEALVATEAWAVPRLFFPHCKMEAPWSEFAFAIDVSDTYELKRAALAVYTSIFDPTDDRLLALYESEDRYFGRMLGVAYAEIFRSASPILLDDPGVIRPGVHG